MNQQPLVSVIIAAKNRGKCIKRAIDSITNQTYKNFEIIIVDGGSTDDTKEVVEPYLKNTRVRYIYKKDKSPAEGRNNGIEISKGKYIAILDSDDSWRDPQKLEKQVKFLEEHPDYVLVGGGAIAIDESENEYYRVLLPEKDEEIRKAILFDCVFPHGTVVFKKNSWKLAGKYDTRSEFGFSEDWDLWLKLGEFGKFYCFPEYFLYYKQSKQGRTQYLRRQSQKFNLKLRWNYRRKYPNFWKAYLLGLGLYVTSFFPHQEWFSKLLIIPKIKNLFFRRQIYKK
jgi:glycosyltransferase involved in cell wall biosynthesis